MPAYELKPEATTPVSTELRSIQTSLPVPESIPVLERLAALEPIAMQGQPPVVWDRAEGSSVWDRWGNRWIDWSSGVLITNAGHAHPRVVKAIQEQVEKHMLTSYCFPNEPRLALLERLVEVLPEPLRKVFLLTTGSETVECAVKLCRTNGIRVGGEEKSVIVSYNNSFHGRTLGSQQAGGIPVLKNWIVNLDPGFVQIPFPDGYRQPDTSFGVFERSLAEAGVKPSQVAGVMLETYQGGDACFAPVEYMQQLRAWCDANGALLVCDEVQAGFGRTGKLWGFEHYGIVPDLTTWGKGISSSLPISAIAGRQDVMDLHPAGSMTSTHSGNPVCCAAALASLEAILEEDMVGNASRMGDVLHQRLAEIAEGRPQIAAVFGKGLVAGVVMVDAETGGPDAALAFDIVKRCLHKGVLMFSPVGFGGGTVKIAPPLMISEAALRESLEVFGEAVVGAMAARSSAVPA